MSLDFQWGGRTDRSTRGRDNASIVHRVARGDDLEQDTIMSMETARMVMDELAKVSGNLAYTPEIQHRINTVLQRRFQEDLGNDVFVPPNYAPYEDKDLAQFYGLDTSMVDNLQSRKETYDEQRARLVREVAREIEPELAGLAINMEQYRVESWARHGVADEDIYTHVDPDITLFRNYDRTRSTLDIPISTTEKTNTLNLYESVPVHVFPEPHPGWMVDRKGGFWNDLS